MSAALTKQTEDAIVNGIWKRPQLSPRDRGIVTVAALVASERTIGFAHYFDTTLETGVTPAELSKIVLHVAFYASWSTAFSAVAVLKDIFADRGIGPDQLSTCRASNRCRPNRSCRATMPARHIFRSISRASLPSRVKFTNTVL